MKDKEIFENKSNSLLETITLSEVSQKEKYKYRMLLSRFSRVRLCATP